MQPIHFDPSLKVLVSRFIWFTDTKAKKKQKHRSTINPQNAHSMSSRLTHTVPCSKLYIRISRYVPKIPSCYVSTSTLYLYTYLLIGLYVCECVGLSVFGGVFGSVYRWRSVFASVCLSVCMLVYVHMPRSYNRSIITTSTKTNIRIINAV